MDVVNNLQLSMPNGNHSQRANIWNDNIPGSNLVMIPYELDKPGDWDMRVYINMSIYSLISIAFIVALCLLLAVVSWVLHYLERVEDKPDHLEYKKNWL